MSASHGASGGSSLSAMTSLKSISAGEVGYVATGLKQVRDCQVHEPELEEVFVELAR